MMEIDLKSENIDTLIQEVSKGVSALTEGPLRRWNEKRDLIHAMNMGKIVEKARAKMGQERSTQENSAPLGVESGWLLNFLDKSKTVSDDEVQDLWASILARESDTPGSFSQLTVNSLENFGRQDAESFISLCRFVCYVNSEPIPFIQNANHEIYTQNGIDSEALDHLCSLNVIETVSAFGDRGVIRPSEPRVNAGKSVAIIYFNEKLEYVNDGEGSDTLNIGSIVFTSIGKEVLSIWERKKVDGFFEYLKHNWGWSRMMGSKIRVEDGKIIRT